MVDTDTATGVYLDVDADYCVMNHVDEEFLFILLSSLRVSQKHIKSSFNNPLILTLVLYIREISRAIYLEAVLNGGLGAGAAVSNLEEFIDGIVNTLSGLYIFCQ
jgi:hypothetical protein